LDTEVNLANLTVVVEDQTEPAGDFVEVEIINDVILGAREMRTVWFALQQFI
jgi:hypothetical protein